MNDGKAAAKVHQNQAPISRSVKSKLGVSKTGKEHIPLNTVFLICYINTQSGAYWVRAANDFQMFKKKILLQYPCIKMTPAITETRGKYFETRTNQVKPNKARRKLEK